MQALTLRQPWACLVVAGIKDVENRTWRTNHRGRLVIHAGSAIDREVMDEHGRLLADCPRGAILGAVELVDIVRDSASPWAIAGNWHWLLDDPRPLLMPIRATGRLGLWTCEVAEMELAEAGHLCQDLEKRVGPDRRSGRRAIAERKLKKAK